ncbi:MAG TPA: hypothetical protein PKY82_10655 [Pyrinomonadaceae bacterium]|nr:hypothetical protein [Pyrinomonadaceae bacterium]
MIKTGLTLLLIFSFFTLQTSIIFAQTNQTKTEKKTAKVKEKINKLGLGEQVKVKVKLYNDSTYEGYVKEATEDNFVVVDKNGASNTIKYSDVNSVGGKNLSTGTKIAIGAGIGVGIGILLAILIVRYGIND